MPSDAATLCSERSFFYTTQYPSPHTSHLPPDGEERAHSASMTHSVAVFPFMSHSPTDVTVRMPLSAVSPQPAASSASNNFGASCGVTHRSEAASEFA